MRKLVRHMYMLLFTGLIMPQFVFAVEIAVDARNKELQPSQQFEAAVFLNTSDEDINAVEGTLLYPADLLRPEEINSANSIINFWVEQPRLERDSRIVFSGIVPGGYKGKGGLLFSVIFQALQEGEGILEVRNARALKNDGIGTETRLSLSPFQFFVSGTALRAPMVVIKDEEKPESFIPEIARDPSIFDGKRFLVFAAQDKGTGISRYEVKETRQNFFIVFSRWRSAESPYMLADQGLRSDIFVKAVDKAGNRRIAKLSSQKPLLWYENYENFGILMLVIMAFIFGRFLWRKKHAGVNS